jgi:hypothetical protein
MALTTESLSFAISVTTFSRDFPLAVAGRRAGASRLSEMEALKKYLREKHSGGTTPGADEIGYRDIMDIPNPALCDLFQLCVQECASPGPWLLALIIGIVKAHKPAEDPDSYRLIAFQSCLLKCATWLCDRRVRAWADVYHILPDSQNGFRAHYRTTNNAFILRCAIDRANADGKLLYVAFVDFSNAFPSTDMPTVVF